MKVLIINTYDTQGGAARAAYRLHQGLLVSGVDSQMLVQTKASDHFTVHSVNSNFQKIRSLLAPMLDALPVRFYKNRLRTPFSPAWVPLSGVLQKINEINPDIVHLHWICGGMLQIKDVAKIKAPIIWTLHDDWGFTGGCHIKGDCERYKIGCGACPKLGSTNERDLSRRIFNTKMHGFLTKKLTMIALSHWMKKCISESALFKTQSIVNLPNPLNTDIFYPVDKCLARELLGLPPTKKLILCGAVNALSDSNKGFHLLVSALKRVNTDMDLVIFGSSQPQQAQEHPQHTHYLGHLHDEVTLRLLYSAADVMVVPSLQEAFGQTAVEAMACETPVVSFGATGLLDMIEHKTNGYLAKPFEPESLAEGIDWVLGCDHYQALCTQARATVVERFDSKVVIPRYIQLYNDLLTAAV